MAPERNMEVVDKQDDSPDSAIRILVRFGNKKDLSTNTQVLNNQYGGGGRIRTTEG